eukprot:3919036-Pleurochrysis_carterae.AAC.1
MESARDLPHRVLRDDLPSKAAHAHVSVPGVAPGRFACGRLSGSSGRKRARGPHRCDEGGRPVDL